MRLDFPKWKSLQLIIFGTGGHFTLEKSATNHTLDHCLHMKYFVLHICLWFAAVTFSQESAKDKSIRQIEMNLVGYWEKTSEDQNGNKYFIEEVNGQLYLNIGKFQRGGLEFNVLDKIFMEIVVGQTIKLKNFILENGGISELIFLDSKKLILKNGGELFEFKRME